MLSVTRYCTGDWSKIKTNYSYVDKQFLNKQIYKVWKISHKGTVENDLPNAYG